MSSSMLNGGTVHLRPEYRVWMADDANKLLRVLGKPDQSANLSTMSDAELWERWQDARREIDDAGVSLPPSDPPPSDNDNNLPREDRESTPETAHASEPHAADPQTSGHKAIKTGQGFFVRMPVDAIDDSRLSHTDFRLLALLIVLCGDKGYSWWTEDDLAQRMVGTRNGKDIGRRSMSGATVERSVQALRRAGYIRVVKPKDLPMHGYKHVTSGNTYILNFSLRKKD